MPKTILYERKEVNGAVVMRLVSGWSTACDVFRSYIKTGGYKYSHRCADYSVYKTMPDSDGISYTLKVYYK